MTASSAAFVFSWAAVGEGSIAFLLYIAEAIMRPDEARMRTGSFGDKTLVLLAQFLHRREVFGGHNRGNAELRKRLVAEHQPQRGGLAPLALMRTMS